MDIQGLRQSLKIKWLSYYEQNRSWLVKMRVWATYNGLRRPSSGFILATLSVLEPEFDQVLAFIMELNNDPDEIVTALGLNFNPDTELQKARLNSHQQQQTETNTQVSNGVTVNTASPAVLSLVDNPVRSPKVGRSPSPIDINQVDEQKATANTSPQVNAVSSNGNNIYSHSGEWTVSDRSSPSPVISTQTLVKPKPPSVRLALVNEIVPNSKTIRILEITTKPSQQKTLPLLKLATQTPQNEQYVKTQTPAPTHKFNPSNSSNATTLASWVDEFCQGTGFEREEVFSL